MSETNQAGQMHRGGAAVLGTLLAVGLIIGGWALGTEIKATRLSDRYVAVRGLAERTVKADLAVWPIHYIETGDDLPSLYSKAEKDRKVILQFLKAQGIEASEIEEGIVEVDDNQANRWGNSKPSYRYVVQQEITVQTNRVDRVAAAAQKTLTLLQQGITLTNQVNDALTYKFTGLNSIKPDMITEATRNARAAAERFAQDSGSQVGRIRQATQGVFSISAANSGDVNADEGGGPGYEPNADSSKMKTVRVVTSVDYYLEK